MEAGIIGAVLGLVTAIVSLITAFVGRKKEVIHRHLIEGGAFKQPSPRRTLLSGSLTVVGLIVFIGSIFIIIYTAKHSGGGGGWGSFGGASGGPGDGTGKGTDHAGTTGREGGTGKGSPHRDTTKVPPAYGQALQVEVLPKSPAEYRVPAELRTYTFDELTEYLAARKKAAPDLKELKILLSEDVSPGVSAVTDLAAWAKDHGLTATVSDRPR